MIPRNGAEILLNHVLLEVEGIDRMYLNDYISLVHSLPILTGCIFGHRVPKSQTSHFIYPRFS